MNALPSRLASIFETKKTMCFGRFLIDIPVTATLVFGPAEAEMPIDYFPGDEEKLGRRLAEHMAKVEESRDFLTQDDIARLPLFGKIVDGVMPGQKIAHGSTDQVGYSVYSFVPKGEDLFVQYLHSVLPDDYSLDHFNEIAEHLRIRAADEIPVEPGSCIDGGFVPLPLEYERVTIGIRFKEFPDVHLSVDVHKNRDRLEESARLELLLEAGESLAKQAGHGSAYARIKTFRRGPRQLGPWKGYEMVARKPAYNNDTDAHEFRFHSLGAVNDPVQPQLDLRFDSGVKNNHKARARPSLSDEEAIALWDKLIGSIRVRPTTNAKPVKAAPVKVPLGKLTATGELCTQSGWWRCKESIRVEGGARRHFVHGELFPHVMLMGESNLWQKLKGTGPTFKMSTVWELVEHDEPFPLVQPLAVDHSFSPKSALNNQDDIPHGKD